MIWIVTPTGNRQRGIDLLAGYLNAQTYSGPATWIIVDDCDAETVIPPMRKGIVPVVVRPPWRWQPGMNTQARSMAEALKHVPDDGICLVMEDDDLYKPDHIDNVLSALQSADLVGEQVARYYNVATRRHKVMGGIYHASLASTACKGAALDMLMEICLEGSRRIDMDLWRRFDAKKTLLDTGNVIGIKGLPGRGGIGVGHRDNFGTPDHGGAVLSEWLGEYAKNYRSSESLCSAGYPGKTG